MAAYYRSMTASGLTAVRTTPDWIRVAHGVTQLRLDSGFVVFGGDSVNHCWWKSSRAASAVPDCSRQGAGLGKGAL